MNKLSVGLFLTLIGGVLLLFIIIVSLWALPRYKVYKQNLEGQAQLREAEWTKRILIEEAKAREEAAILQARAKVTLAEAEGQAEIVRSKATAEANKIIGDSLKNNEAYLRYLWIMGLHDGKGERIYVPTEAGLPILEAGKAGTR
jgi:hypothetical protein